MKQGFIWLGLFLLLFRFSAQAEDFERIEDLSLNWYYNEGSISLPYVKGNNIDAPAIHFELNLARYPENYLTIKHIYPGLVFVNGKVFKVSEGRINLRLPVDSLLDIYPEGKILITCFSEKGDYDKLATHISATAFTFKNAAGGNNLIVKRKYERSDLIVILLLILSFFAIALNRNKKSFQDFYSLEETLAGRIKDDSVYKLKLFSQNNLVIFLFHASILAFLVMLLARYSDARYSFEKYFFQSEFLTWTLLSVLVFIVFFFKYLIIKYIGELFDLGNSANYYFYEFMRLSMAFFLVLFVLAAVVVISYPHKADNMAQIGINITFFFMVIRLVFLFFRIGKVSGFKNVHLFSYLCTTETLPIIVGMRYFLA